jgi:formamidopyrimidine-DNA glycosylase
MPELPEVETFKRFIDNHALKKPIEQVQVFKEKILSGVTTTELQQAVEHHQFSHTLRHGKYLFVEVTPKQTKTSTKPSGWVLLHFGMTGYLSYWDKQKTLVNAYGDPTRPHAHIRVQFDFKDDSHLAFHEQRMFGYIALISDPQTYIKEKKLGPDALAMDEQTFLERLKQRKGQMKPILMDQTFVAGIGNVYADEMLFQCHIHPQKTNSELNTKERKHLFQQMRDVLQNTVHYRADRDQLPRDYLLHHRRPKGRCPRDKTPLESKSVGGRTTYFCPVCQPD